MDTLIRDLHPQQQLADLVVAPIRCLECAGWFTPLKASQRFCRNRCSKQWHGRRLRGIHPTHATAARVAQAAQRLAEAVRAEFGALSAREQQLYRFAWKKAWQRGYNTAMQHHYPARRSDVRR